MLLHEQKEKGGVNTMATKRKSNQVERRYGFGPYIWECSHCGIGHMTKKSAIGCTHKEKDYPDN